MQASEPQTQTDPKTMPLGKAPTHVSVELWAQLQEWVEKSVRRVCPPWLSDRRDDLVQVSLMKVMAILEKSEGKRELGPSYLSRVAYSALVDEIRSLRRRQEVPLTDEEGDERPVVAPHPNPEKMSMDRQLGRSINECLTRMVPPRRLAVTLNLQGHSVPESARLLDWGPKKTENLVYRGLADLRRCLKGKGWGR